MRWPALHRSHLLAAAVFVAAALVLAIQLITPSPIVVSVGDSNTTVSELGSYFSYEDVGVIALLSCLVGASGTYLLTATPESDASDPSPATPGANRSTTNGQEPASAPPRAVPSSSDPTEGVLETRQEEWEETAERLVSNEADVYETVLAADGVRPQSEIVDETDLSKATVSRTLDKLESKNLVERKQRGMGNVVVLM